MEVHTHQSSAPLDRRILVPQIEQSFAQLPVSLIVNLVNGFILAVVLRGAVADAVLLGWLAVLVAVTAARFMTLRAFRRAARHVVVDHAAWTRHFVVGACATGVVWGASGILLFHPQSFPHQVFLVFVLGGMVAGAVPLLSSIRSAYACFAIPAVVPISVRMLSAGDPIHVIMGLMIAIFGVAMLASSAEVHRLFRDSESLRRELLSSLEVSRALEHLVRLDTLTEIPNRRLFEEELGREWGSAERNKEPLSVILADIDHFKEYNDRYGHPAGDRCLVEVAQAMRRALVRPGDVVARIGGEEFAFLLPRTNITGAIAVAEHVRAQIHTLQLPHAASPVADHITLSFGVSSSEHPSVASAADMIRAADRALYDAKHHGKSRIASAVA